jgi:transposase-like protein
MMRTYCGSEEYRKNGVYREIQRYLCKGCGRYFSDKVRKFDYATRAKALDMYLNNVGIRKTARFIGASPGLIVHWVRQAGERLVKKQLEQALEDTKEKLPDVIEMDEIYTYVEKNSKGQLYGLLILGGRNVLLRMR